MVTTFVFLDNFGTSVTIAESPRTQLTIPTGHRRISHYRSLECLTSQTHMPLRVSGNGYITCILVGNSTHRTEGIVASNALPSSTTVFGGIYPVSATACVYRTGIRTGNSAGPLSFQF